MKKKRCGKCGFIFEGEGDYCTGCTNGHGTDREEIPEITQALDEFFGYSGPDKEGEDE